MTDRPTQLTQSIRMLSFRGYFQLQFTYEFLAQTCREKNAAGQPAVGPVRPLDRSEALADQRPERARGAPSLSCAARGAPPVGEAGEHGGGRARPWSRERCPSRPTTDRRRRRVCCKAASAAEGGEVAARYRDALRQPAHSLSPCVQQEVLGIVGTHDG